MALSGLAVQVFAAAGEASAAETVSGSWSGVLAYDFVTSTAEPTGWYSESKVATWVLDGTDSPQVQGGLQPADISATVEENGGHSETTDCPTGMTFRRQGAFSGRADAVAQATVTDTTDPGTWSLSLSAGEDPFAATETGTGCWEPSPPPVLEQVTVSLLGRSFPSATTPASVQGSFSNPNAATSGHECTAWRLTRSPDADHDGIPDADDPEPAVPAAAPTCTSDADGDGVDDGLDMCPNTPPGTAVDAHGCPVGTGPSVPGSPTGVEAAAGDGQVTVSWQPPADNGGAPITRYDVQVTDATGGPPSGVAGATTRTAAGSPFTFTGLTNGTGYAFVVSAVSTAGTGSGSAPSAAVRPRPVISIGDASVVEGSSGMRGLRFSVGLSAPSTRAVSFHYATRNGTASSQTDYVATTGTATVGAGLADIALTVPVKGDSTAEANESFTVTISAPVDGAVGTAAGKGVILNDDPPARGRRVSVGNASVAEGRQDNRSLTLTVTLSALSRSSVTVHFDLVDGTASGSDYQGGSGTLRFAPGQRTSLLSFSVRGDTDLEPSETVRVILSRPQGAVLGRRQGTATILNDD